MQSAYVETATGATYALGGLICIYLSTKLKPQHMIYVNFAIINVGSIVLIVFYKTDISMLWLGNSLIGLGFSSTYATASLFLLAGGAGTAILPLFLSDLCTNPSSIIIMSKQIDMIKKKLIDNPAILLGYREKSLSVLTM
ncbi:unnamed protein product [Medioppia subpectinata]|uniref:Uncharacterized protein n=1 Tax=Medioppia subpectinata TaxID=1979941 RepID=A0A7R9LL55_9ACAR|nr:unnamed protein product [Medioppia subpectinata]CAG2119731.1 unnamed protein product [Medioppia subpectinata]